MFWQCFGLFMILAVAGVVQAQTQAPDYGKDVTLDTAKKVMATAESEAKKNNWNMVIAIVDTHGLLIMLERLDNTQTASVKVAIDKARTAAMFKRPTKVFEDAVAGGRMPLLGMEDIIPIEGGIPLMQEGKIIGAIGVSGMSSQQDGQVAKAGAEVTGK
jgi:glc operon protein GlcG